MASVPDPEHVSNSMGISVNMCKAGELVVTPEERHHGWSGDRSRRIQRGRSRPHSRSACSQWWTACACRRHAWRPSPRGWQARCGWASRTRTPFGIRDMCAVPVSSAACSVRLWHSITCNSRLCYAVAFSTFLQCQHHKLWAGCVAQHTEGHCTVIMRLSLCTDSCCTTI